MAAIMRFELPDDEWKRIAQYSNLPAQARPLVEEAIALFRTFDAANRYTASEIRTELKELHELAADLHARLSTLVADPDARAALTVESKSPRDPSRNRIRQPRIKAHLRLESSLGVVNALAEWLSLASHRVSPMRPGANRKASNVRWLVARLDAIMKESTERSISRSGKRTNLTRDYIASVCHIADPSIGRGTIDAAMQTRIRQTRHRR
jgi:hypothetical protein